jgi:hypothetical protein
MTINSRTNFRNMPSITLMDTDISTAHRIGKQLPADGSPGTVRTQPIVVRFTRRSTRNDVLAARKELKGKKIAVTEQLTPNRSQLLKKATELMNNEKVLGAWSHDGKILVNLG